MKAQARQFSRWLWREWIRPLALPLLLVTTAKSALADINYVPTGSMKPTVLEGDVLFINKLAYDLRVPFTFARLARWGDPARGDVVVCFSPTDGTRLVKRVIGVPGDTIEMRNEILLINSVPLTYSAATPAGDGSTAASPAGVVLAREHFANGRAHAVIALPQRAALRSFGPITVPGENYFMLGDNRDNSHDSRFYGCVPRREIIGEATAVVASADLEHWLRPRFDRFCTKLE